MEIAGITTDLAVTDLDLAVAFYADILERAPDLRPDDRSAEWILHRRPEIALRLVAREGSPASGFRIGIGVADVARERARLSAVWGELPSVTTRPGVIAQLELRDPDHNLVALWQDLMHR